MSLVSFLHHSTTSDVVVPGVSGLSNFSHTDFYLYLPLSSANLISTHLQIQVMNPTISHISTYTEMVHPFPKVIAITPS